MRQSTNTHFHKLSHANETSTLASRSILQAMATGGVVPQLRVSHVVRPRPSGRYVYESSSEEEEDACSSLLSHPFLQTFLILTIDFDFGLKF